MTYTEPLFQQSQLAPIHPTKRRLLTTRWMAPKTSISFAMSDLSFTNRELSSRNSLRVATWFGKKPSKMRPTRHSWPSIWFWPPMAVWFWPPTGNTIIPHLAMTTLSLLPSRSCIATMLMAICCGRETLMPMMPILSFMMFSPWKERCFCLGQTGI